MVLHFSASVEHWSNLQVLQISSNSYMSGGAGAEILARGLIHCTQLCELYISDNQIRDDGATALAGTLKHLSNLQVLDVSNNEIRESGCSAIINALKDCTKLCTLNVSGIASIKLALQCLLTLLNLFTHS